jgi:predicted component of type VI protein secretion system
VLVTYTWRSEGQIFPVREGRNFLGSDLECDVALDGDSHLSSRHATILYRGRGFWIDDEKSMNGTFVDGECVEEKQPLSNYARIRTGSTEWSFVVLEPSSEEG